MKVCRGRRRVRARQLIDLTTARPGSVPGSLAVRTSVRAIYVLPAIGERLSSLPVCLPSRLATRVADGPYDATLRRGHHLAPSFATRSSSRLILARLFPSLPYSQSCGPRARLLPSTFAPYDPFHLQSTDLPVTGRSSFPPTPRISRGASSAPSRRRAWISGWVAAAGCFYLDDSAVISRRLEERCAPRSRSARRARYNTAKSAIARTSLAMVVHPSPLEPDSSSSRGIRPPGAMTRRLPSLPSK